MPETIAFEGQQTIATVEEAYVRLCAALAQSADIEIDLAAVTQADLAFVQLLLAARASAATTGGRLAWRGVDCPAVLEVLARGGLSADRLFEPTKGEQQ